jgi:hypothetical protein
MPIEDTYSPMIHRINQAIKQRAVHPDEAVGPAAELLVRYVRISILTLCVLSATGCFSLSLRFLKF